LTTRPREPSAQSCCAHLISTAPCVRMVRDTPRSSRKSQRPRAQPSRVHPHPSSRYRHPAKWRKRRVKIRPMRTVTLSRPRERDVPHRRQALVTCRGRPDRLDISVDGTLVEIFVFSWFLMRAGFQASACAINYLVCTIWGGCKQVIFRRLGSAWCNPTYLLCSTL